MTQQDLDNMKIAITAKVQPIQEDISVHVDIFIEPDIVINLNWGLIGVSRNGTTFYKESASWVINPKEYPEIIDLEILPRVAE
jgi:hypothetical protein